MNFTVLPAADGDAIAAAIWYEDQQPGLADDFFAEMQHAYSQIQLSPMSAPVLEHYSGSHQIRRRLMRRFPFAVVYLCRLDEILVVAVAHTRRRPLYWLDRLT